MAAAGKLKLLLGRCLPRVTSNAVRVSVQKLDFDDFLHMYFNKQEVYNVHDPEHICKSGDTVLIQQLPEKVTRTIEYKVLEVIYPMGDIEDPITKKKVVWKTYRDDIKKVNELYGALPTAFDYDKAPPRGRLEGTRDLTDKPTYRQYAWDDKSPYAWPK